MKNLFTNKIFTLLAFISFTLASCEEINVNPDKPDPSDCKLTSFEYEYSNNGSTNRDEYDIVYNNQGFVTQDIGKFYTGTTFNYTYITDYIYNSSNQLIRENYTMDDKSNGYYTYDYNPDGTLKTKIRYNATDIQTYSENYTYNTNKKVVESMENFNGTIYKNIFEYAGNSENVSKITRYDSNNQVTRTTTYENYDDKLRPFNAFKGFISTFKSKNNPGKMTTVSKSATAGQPDVTVIRTYTNTYNKTGYATEVVEKNSSNSNEFKQTFIYSGCD